MTFVNKEADDARRPQYFKRYIAKKDAEKLTKESALDFNYQRFMGLIKYSDAKQKLDKDDIEIVNVYVLRNVFRNEVFVDRNIGHLIRLNNKWVDYLKFDDFEIYGAKIVMDRVMGSLSARTFMKELHGKTSLRVEGAIFIKNTFYTLTQIILPDSFVDLPSNLTTKKIWDEARVQILGKDYEKEMLLMSVNKSLKIVGKG